VNPLELLPQDFEMIAAFSQHKGHAAVRKRCAHIVDDERVSIAVAREEPAVIEVPAQHGARIAFQATPVVEVPEAGRRDDGPRRDRAQCAHLNGCQRAVEGEELVGFVEAHARRNLLDLMIIWCAERRGK
jgi:hypothetical protein